MSEGKVNVQLRYRNACFTINNWEEPVNLFEQIKKLWKNDKVKYIVIGKEIGKQGTPHLQGYCEFTGRPTFNTLRKWFCKGHFEARKGTAKQAADYCKKDGDYWEKGDISQPGKRTDMQDIRNKLLKKKPIRDIALKYPGQYIRYHKGINALNNILNNFPRTEKPFVTWIYGKSGVGKTKYVFDNHKDIYIKDETKWWDGYNNNEAILIDDFEGIWPFRSLLRFLDRYPYQGEYKGGYTHINSPYIYFTSEFPPEHYYYDEHNENHFKQLSRRIDKEIHIDEFGTHVFQ